MLTRKDGGAAFPLLQLNQRGLGGGLSTRVSESARRVHAADVAAPADPHIVPYFICRQSVGSAVPLASRVRAIALDRSGHVSQFPGGKTQYGKHGDHGEVEDRARCWHVDLLRFSMIALDFASTSSTFCLAKYKLKARPRAAAAQAELQTDTHCHESDKSAYRQSMPLRRPSSERRRRASPGIGGGGTQPRHPG